MLAAYAAWLLVATLLGLGLRWGYFGFGTAVVVFLLANTLGALVLDFVLYSGRLTPLGWLGVGLAGAAMACIEYGRVTPD